MKKRIPSQFWMLLVFLLVACGQSTEPITPNERDTSIISGQPCLLPCWQNLKPGTTTTDEALAFLETSSLAEKNVGQRISAPSGKGFSQSWEWASKLYKEKSSNSLQFDGNGRLEIISLFPNTAITVEDVVKVYGAPTFLSIFLSPPPPDLLFSNAQDQMLVVARYTNDNFEILWSEDVGYDQKIPVRFCPKVSSVITEVRSYTVDLAKIYENDWVQRPPQIGGVITKGSNVFQIQNAQITMACVEV
jgi:hypothetical protein